MIETKFKAEKISQLLSWHFEDIRVLPDISRYWAKCRPTKVALIDGTASQTYGELDVESDRVAAFLLANGVAPGGHIGYIGRNSLEFYAIWLGVTKAGCALSPFNWRCAAEELVSIIGDAAPPVIFVTADSLDLMKTVQARSAHPFRLIEFTPAGRGGHGLAPWLDAVGESLPLPQIQPLSVALLSYTSGTTGRPKGAMATHEAFSYSFLCEALEPAMAWHADDVMLMSMPNFHLGGSWVSLSALYHGATLSILPAFEPNACLAAIIRDRITIAPMVPAAIQMLLDLPDVGPASFGSLRSVIYFGSPISPGLMREAVRQMGCGLSQYYGTTETWFLTILRHEHHIDDGSARLTSCGQPLPLVSVRISDGSGGEADTGVVGEVLVRTPMVFSGYWNRPEATTEALQEGWYHTGDLGRFDAEGFLYIVDRAKDMIISGGENIYSTEVELALHKLDAVRSCAVVGLPDPKWGERVVAAIVLHEGEMLTSEAVIAHCRGLIAGYKVPKQIVFVDALPLTPTGKVRKVALRDTLQSALADPIEQAGQ